VSRIVLIWIVLATLHENIVESSGNTKHVTDKRIIFAYLISYVTVLYFYKIESSIIDDRLTENCYFNFLQNEAQFILEEVYL
jgi:hypothetical protein